MFDLKIFVAVSLLLCLLVNRSNANENPKVHTPLGVLKGSLMQTRLKKPIYAFRGVRYGKSTEGDRRFKVAEPIQPWAGVFDASEEGPSCPLLAKPETTSEDCLRLNVYANKLPNKNNNVKRPVIVFFHPGAFYGFSAQSFNFGPEYYLDQNIVLVTVNYRLGTFGFLSTGDARLPGNLGLKDQVEALRWIQRNIASFGGDPNSVTITGYSAGSTSVILHMLSPMSKGLFQRAVAMSGSPLTLDPTPHGQPNIVIKQAGFVGCPTDSIDAALDCLKTVPQQNITNSMPRFAEWYGDPIVVWSPVVEPNVPGVERFITAQPADLIRTKQFYHVPLITGITKDEFASAPLAALVQAINGDDRIYKNVTKNWEFAAPISFMYERGTERSKCISREIYKYYFNNEPITVKNGENLGLIYADSIIGFPAYRLAQLMSEYSNAPVYHYMFTYQGRYSFARWRNDTPYGVVHHDDLQYLYTMPAFNFPQFKEGDPEISMVERYTSIYANFAKTGKPIPRDDNFFRNVTWVPRTPENDAYLEIGKKFRMKSKMYPDRYAFWGRLFPLLPVESTC